MHWCEATQLSRNTLTVTPTHPVMPSSCLGVVQSEPAGTHASLAALACCLPGYARLLLALWPSWSGKASAVLASVWRVDTAAARPSCQPRTHLLCNVNCREHFLHSPAPESIASQGHPPSLELAHEQLPSPASFCLAGRYHLLPSAPHTHTRQGQQTIQTHRAEWHTHRVYGVPRCGDCPTGGMPATAVWCWAGPRG